MSDTLDWVTEFPAPVTVCDRDGVVVLMNRAAQESFAKYGGAGLVGQNLMACHSEESQPKLRQLLKHGLTNTYTIEKQGRKKLIYQAPWSRDGVYQGLVEISIELPEHLPHFVRE
jgi:transcriptional regulator with PAS, ATPase and Fis domain